MMQQTKKDVVIVGGGVIGVSTAYYAASRGASVTVVEKGCVGSGSSYGNAGLIVPTHCHPLPTPGVVAQGLRYLLDPDGPFYIHLKPDPELARWLWKFYRSCNEKHLYHAIGIFRKLGTESLELHQELSQSGGKQYQCDLNGLLSLFISEKAFEEAQAEALRMQIYGIEMTVLNGDEARRLEPSVGPQVIGGLLGKTDGRLDPAAFVTWLARQAESKGVEFVTDTEVYWLKTSGRHVTSVVTTHGDLEAEQVVLATGAWMPQLAQDLGVSIPIQAAKGYSLTFQRPENSPKLPLLLEEARVAVTPFSNTFRLAGTLELDGMDLRIHRRRLRAIEAHTYRYLPRLGEMKTLEVWRGLRPCTPDGLPVLGRLHPYTNVLVAGGHGTKGISLGPVTGKYLSDLLAGESIGMMERSLRVNRF